MKVFKDYYFKCKRKNQNCYFHENNMFKNSRCRYTNVRRKYNIKLFKLGVNEENDFFLHSQNLQLKNK